MGEGQVWLEKVDEGLDLLGNRTIEEKVMDI